ncbi:MAG: MoaD/ThiS family protein [Desulfovibrio sp.]|nr:MoaD/ThiS family protein [Desulfovibrio sp.]
MALHIKLSTTLRSYLPDYDSEKGLELELDPATRVTAADIAARLGLPPDEIKFIMLNGRCMDMETPLGPDDRLAFFPAVGGG